MVVMLPSGRRVSGHWDKVRAGQTGRRIVDEARELHAEAIVMPMPRGGTFGRALETVLRESDFLVLSVPLLDDTETLLLVSKPPAPEVVASLRITKSFNFLAGLSYDHVISASGSNSSSLGSTTSSSDADVSGRYLGAQLWLGLGGYAF